MALFKVFNNIDNTGHTLPDYTVKGYCYFDASTKLFWIDIKDGNNLTDVYDREYRVPLNAYVAEGANYAQKLTTARKINGTNFDGSIDITTSKWGTARTISISGTAGTTGTSIDGSANKDLIIPKTLSGFTKITSTNFTGSLTGNADTATKFASAQSVALTGDVTGTTSSQAGWSVATTLANSGVTAGNYGPSANASPAHGGTFSVPYVTVDAKGRVTSASTKTITLPADNNTDTKNTAGSTNNTSKLFLVGAASQAANPQTYSHSAIYETAGTLNATVMQVAEKVQMQYDTTNQCLNFVFI